MTEIDANTVLCLHCDGADGSTSFPDASLFEHAMVASGNIQVDVAQRKFGSGSALFDGTTDWLATPDSPDWIDGTKDFTIDSWVQWASHTTDQALFAQVDAAGNQWGWAFERHNWNNSWVISWSVDGIASTYQAVSWIPVDGVWYHGHCPLRDSHQVFVVGTQVGTGTIAASIFNSTAPLRIEHATPMALHCINGGWMKSESQRCSLDSTISPPDALPNRASVHTSGHTGVSGKCLASAA
jgi:hypothetical protein